ncbi:MAG: tripartite tricarboxylate transporter substrate binding protein [Betaproteobacteria bacterium]
MRFRCFFIVACVCGILALSESLVLAQSYPSKPVRIIVPFPPGGSTDLTARVLGAKLGEAFNQQFIVENRPGASGMIGNDAVARAPADGYLLIMGTIGALSVNQYLFKKVPYDSLHDFSPISLTGNVENLLVVHPSLPVHNVKEFIAKAKTLPGKLIFASSGTGNAPHLAGELFNQMAHVQLVHLPYKGGGPAIIDLISGQVSLSFSSMPSSLPFVKQAKLRPIGVGGKKRSVAAPDIPTIDESGLAGFEVTDWQGLLAPAKTPPAVIERLHTESLRALNETSVKDRLAAAGLQVVTCTPSQFTDFIRSEINKWGKVIQAAGIKPE